MPIVVEKKPSTLEPSLLLLAFVKRLIRNAQEYPGPERRSEERQGVALPATVQPMDEHTRPIGQPIAMVTHSLSKGGVGLVHEQPMHHDRLAIQFFVDGEEVVLAGVVKWRFPLGPYNSFGCEVTAKLSSFPVAECAEVDYSSTVSRFERTGVSSKAITQTVSTREIATLRDTT